VKWFHTSAGQVLLINAINLEKTGWPADFHSAKPVKSKAVIEILNEQNRLHSVSLPKLKEYAPVDPQTGKRKPLYFAWIHAREFDKEAEDATFWCAAPDEPLEDYLGGYNSTRLLVSTRDSHHRRTSAQLTIPDIPDAYRTEWRILVLGWSYQGRRRHILCPCGVQAACGRADGQCP